MLLYFLGMALLTASTHGAYRVASAGRGNIMLGPAQAFGIVGVLAFLAFVAMFITGFFQLAWWVPLAAIPISWIVGGITSAVLPPMLAPLPLVGGVGLTILAFN